MRRTLARDIRKFIEKLEHASWELFVSRDLGSFDLRAYVITEFVSKKIEYRLTEGLDNSGQRASGIWSYFHRAAHAIGEFYAHSSYAGFGLIQNGSLAVYDPNNPASSLPQAPEYGPGSDFDITSGAITTNAALWKGSAQEAAALWKGKLISRRYAQKSGSHGIIEGVTFILAALKKDKDFFLVDRYLTITKLLWMRMKATMPCPV